MASRLDLHEELCVLLGTRNVYFQPPESVRLIYPCIVYSLSGANTEYAGNKTYLMTDQYNVQIISKDPDYDLYKTLAGHFSMCRYIRRFVMNNLYHDTLIIFY